MNAPNNHHSIRIAVPPGAGDAFVQAVRSALQADATATLLLDMGQVVYADPATLESLRAALDAARQGGRQLWLDHVGADVYKALQLAKLGSMFKRVHRGAAAEQGAAPALR
jgi:anti-anti-sigma regulatory factor